MVFKSRKDILFSILIISVCVLLLSILAYDVYNHGLTFKSFWPLLVILLVVIFLIWMFFYTKYILTPQTLKYQCGPIRGKIAIDSIKEIQKGKTLWVGFRPATATKGLIIKYNKFDEIYISPNTNQEFINKILELNNAIKIS